MSDIRQRDGLNPTKGKIMIKRMRIVGLAGVGLAGACLLWGAIGLNATAAESAKANFWQDCPKGFTYESEHFSCSFKVNGTLKNLRVPGCSLISQMLLHGRYSIVGEKHDNRFFQSNITGAQPLQAMKKDANTILLRKSSILKNKKYARAANFNQTVTLTPDRLEFGYEVETLVDLASKSGIFLALNHLPISSFANRGFRTTDTKGKQKLAVFPQAYSKETGTNLGGIKTLELVLDKGHFIIEAGEKTGMRLMDTRSWGGKTLRIDITQRVPWHPKPQTIPAGTKFKWSFSYKYDAGK
jgi:hypothetical protein